MVVFVLTIELEGNEMRFINDSRGMVPQPPYNVQFMQDSSGPIPRLYVEAIANIAAGQELFLDYGDNYWKITRIYTFASGRQVLRTIDRH